MKHFEQDYFDTSSLEGHYQEGTAKSAHIHESSYVDFPCQIGENTEIMRFSHVMAHSIIGNNCLIGNNVTVASGVYIANNVQVMNNTSLNSGVILEDNVYCGASTVFTENKWLRSDRATDLSRSQVAPTIVRQGAKIGANTTVGSGIRIGKFAFVEAGTVIDSHVPDFAIVYGNPLKFAGWQCQCGKTLAFDETSFTKEGSHPQTIECANCGRVYAQTGQFQVIPVFVEAMPNLAHIAHEGLNSDSHSQSFQTIREHQNRD